MLKQRPLLTETREPVRGGCVACDFLAATADREDFFASRMLHDVLGLHQQHRQPPFLALGGASATDQAHPRQLGLVVVMDPCEVNPRCTLMIRQGTSYFSART